MNEVWKRIPDYPAYEVSDHGRVQSYYKQLGVCDWVIASTPQRILKGGLTRHGYRQQYLTNPAGKDSFYVHQLVADAFIGPCPEGLEVCHNDSNPQNNCIGNLRYDTHLSNMHDVERKLNMETARQIRRDRAEGMKLAPLAEKYGVSESAISLVARGLRWPERKIC